MEQCQRRRHGERQPGRHEFPQPREFWNVRRVVLPRHPGNQPVGAGIQDDAHQSAGRRRFDVGAGILQFHSGPHRVGVAVYQQYSYAQRDNSSRIPRRKYDVPTTNAAAITESGVPAASSPGVTYVGCFKRRCHLCCRLRQLCVLIAFSIPVVLHGAVVIITTTNQTGSGTGTFYPSWTDVTNGSLIAGQLPPRLWAISARRSPGRNVNSLTASNNLGHHSDQRAIWRHQQHQLCDVRQRDRAGRE